MNGMLYVNRLSPWVVHVEWGGIDLGLRWYGLAYVAGVVAGFLWFRAASRRRAVANLTPAVVEELALLLVAGVLVGARLGYVLQHPRALLADPLFAIRVWEGGMTFFGGLAGVLLVLWRVARRHGIAFLALGDIATFPAALGLTLGRVANFINGELVGRPTGGNWGVVFPTVDGLPRHPSQLYEAVSHVVLFVALWAATHYAPRWVRGRAGRLSGLFLVLYGVLRTATDVFRADDAYVGPLSTGQLASLAVALCGVVLLRAVRRPGHAEPDARHDAERDDAPHEPASRP